jgi:hypothetical protein
VNLQRGATVEYPVISKKTTLIDKLLACKNVTPIELHKIGSAKCIRLTNGQWINRDEVGVRNSLLRALVDAPDNCVVAVANSSK